MDARYFHFQLGNFQCTALCDGSMDSPSESFVQNVPMELVVAALQAAGLPVNRIHLTTPYTYLYVNTGEHRVLVDIGAGKLGPKTGKLLQSLQLAGLSPAQIDSVFITHAHPDHVGGALDEAGCLVFANARYFIWKSEWDFWFSTAALEKTGEWFTQVARSNLQAMSGQVTLVEAENELLPGVSMLAAPGHTPGHAIVAFTSQGQRLFYIGDALALPILLEHPDWIFAHDFDSEQAGLSQRRILNLATETNALVLGMHFFHSQAWAPSRNRVLDGSGIQSKHRNLPCENGSIIIPFHVANHLPAFQHLVCMPVLQDGHPGGNNRPDLALGEQVK